MTETQQSQHSRHAAAAVAPQEFKADGRVVTAHTALTEPLITVEGLEAVLTPREAISLSERLVASCAEICEERPDIAQRDQLDTMIEGSGREQSCRQRLTEFVEAVAPVIVDTYAHSPWRMGVTSAMMRLRAEQERLNAEAAESADLQALPSA